MVDQSHNLKPKIEAMIQTVTTAQELFAKACIVALVRDGRTASRMVCSVEAADGFGPTLECAVIAPSSPVICVDDRSYA